MKQIIYTIGCLMSVLAVSCVKEEPISVQKQNDLQWKVDSKVVSNDIREQVGYDPRFSQLYFSDSQIDMENQVFAGNFLSPKSTIQIKVLLTKPATQDIKVSVAYDTDLFEKIKENHSGYNLGDKNLVTIPTPEATISAGENSATFEIFITNTDTDRLLFPISLKKESNEQVKVLEALSTAAIKITKTNVSLGNFTFQITEDNLSEGLKKALTEGKEQVDKKWGEIVRVIRIGKTGMGEAIDFELVAKSSGKAYNTGYLIKFGIDDKGQVTMTNGKGGNFWDRYYKQFFNKFVETIYQKAPYKIGSSPEGFKMTSSSDASIYFYINK